MEVVKKYSDADLLAAIKSPRQSDLNEAIRFMYKNYFEALKIYTLQNSGTDEDAQDIFQDTLVSFIDVVKKEKFRGESSIKTFLYTINRNLWLNELKKRGRKLERENIFEQQKDSTSNDILEKITDNESRKETLNIVDKLGEKCKQILLAYYYENLSMKEILVQVEYETEQALRNKKSKCLKQLEEMLTTNPLLAKKLKTALRYE
jgi:RNA polymerase sigma factor (sigma-70 family)